MKTRLKKSRFAPVVSPPVVANGAAKIKLDLSFGDCPAGFTRAAFDPCQYLWPLESESVEEAYSAFMLNRVSGAKRFAFMENLWRVLVPQGKVTVIVPYWLSFRAVQDSMSQWPPLCEQSFLYFNKQFRETNRIYPDVKCDFDFVYGYSLDGETTLRPDDTRAFWIKHYANAILDLQVTLTKRA